MARNKLLLSRPRSMENTLAERIHRDGDEIVADYDDNDDYNSDRIMGGLKSEPILEWVVL